MSKYIELSRALMYIADIQLTVSDASKPTIAPRDLCEWIFEGIKDLPTIEVSEDNQVLYGTDHNCILTMFGECSYNETGCGDCAVAEKIRKALRAEVSEDCISREFAIYIIKNYDFEFPKYMERFVTELRDAMKKDLVEDIKDAPSVVPKDNSFKDGQKDMLMFLLEGMKNALEKARNERIEE